MVHIKNSLKKKVKKSARRTKSQNSLTSHLKLGKEEENQIFLNVGRKNISFEF